MSLVQSLSEKATAEGVRMSLRQGLHRMLDNMQKEREHEPARVVAMADELKMLCKVPRLCIRYRVDQRVHAHGCRAGAQHSAL